MDAWKKIVIACQKAKGHVSNLLMNFRFISSSRQFSSTCLQPICDHRREVVDSPAPLPLHLQKGGEHRGKSSMTTNDNLFTDSQTEFNETQKKLAEIWDESQKQLSESQKKVVYTWISNHPQETIQADVSERFEKALNFQRELVNNTLNALQKGGEHSGKSTNGTFFTDSQRELNESQKKLADIWDKSQQQLSESQKKVVYAWIDNLPKGKIQADLSEGFEKALNFQRELVNNTLNAQQTALELAIQSQKQFWDNYFQITHRKAHKKQTTTIYQTTNQ